MTSMSSTAISRKLLAAGMLVILVLAAATFWWRGMTSVAPSSSVVVNGAQNQSIESSKNATLSAPIAEAEIVVRAQVDSARVSSVDDSLNEWTDSVEQKLEFDSWAKSRGHVPTPWMGDEYDAYDNATLQALAENNQDIKAMTFLGIRLPGEERIKWLNRAAVYGSSNALAWIGSGYATLHTTEPEEVKKAGLVNALAYKKVAELRNDFYSSSSVNMRLYESKLGIILSDQDKAIAEQKALLLYSELEAQRIQLGLGKFDNSVPPAVEAYYRKFIY